MLKVSVVIARADLRRWEGELLSRINALPFVSLSIVMVESGPSPRSQVSWLFRSWKRFEQKAFRKKLASGGCGDDPFNNDLDSLLVGAAIKAEVPACSLADVVGEESPDVVVWNLSERPSTTLTNSASVGIWTLPNATQEVSGYRELVGRIPVTACTLISLAANQEDDRQIGSAYAATDPLSLCRGLQVVRAKDQSLLISALRRLHLTGERPNGCLVGAGGAAEMVVPAALGLLWGLARLYGRYAWSLVTRRFYFNHWQIAYRRGGDRLSQDGLLSFIPDHRGFWADPFVMNWKGQTALFFEELLQGETRGNIVVSGFDEDGKPGPPKTIIDCDYHLSYPFLFDYEGDLYMTPESAAANRIESYRCVEFPGRWEPYGVLMDGLKAYDPTLIEYNGRWWMFAAIEGDGNSSADELHLYHAPNPFAEWTPHPMNPINSDVRSARPGGALFWDNGELYRPAQDCSVRYGYALSIQKILRMTEDEYEEVGVRQILPEWTPNSLGTHTVNQAAGITVYDTFTRRRK